MRAAKKPTKKEIAKELRSLDCTRIHRIAAKCGVDANSFYDVINFVHNNATSVRINNKACDSVRRRSLDRDILKSKCENWNTDTMYWINEAKKEAKRGRDNYSKIMIEGNRHIYWASPVYQHSDYNKSRAMPNTERNREVMRVINNYLAKHGIN